MAAGGRAEDKAVRLLKPEEEKGLKLGMQASDLDILTTEIRTQEKYNFFIQYKEYIT